MVADLLRGFVREDWVAGLDLDSLERVREIGVAPALHGRDDDLLSRVRLHRNGQEPWLYVYLLLELQATVDPWNTGLLRFRRTFATVLTGHPHPGSTARCPGAASGFAGVRGRSGMLVA